MTDSAFIYGAKLICSKWLTSLTTGIDSPIETNE